MTVEEIASLPVGDLAEPGAHLFLWTTTRYLHDAYHVVDRWGFVPSAVLVWCKPANQGLFGGAFLSNVEFIVFARRGSLATVEKQGSRWFTWPRGKHSQKPEAFQDIVEQVSPGPYLELFARRKRLGWHVWGNEVESDIELVA